MNKLRKYLLILKDLGMTTRTYSGRGTRIIYRSVTGSLVFH